MVVRGSVAVDKIAELFGVTLETAAQHSNVSTIAGLLNSVAGHVPRTGEVVEFDGLRFDVLESNQRKVLRVRARRTAAAPISTARAV
jgi:CBS domain containing-hemolysin-like protein